MNLRQLFELYIDAYKPEMRKGFVLAVARDTLTERQLGIYLAQDIHYLEAMSLHLELLGRQLKDRESRLLLKKHEEDALKTCTAMRKIWRMTSTLRSMLGEPIRPTTYAYLNHQRASIEKVLAQAFGACSLVTCSTRHSSKKYGSVNRNRSFCRPGSDSFLSTTIRLNGKIRLRICFSQ